MVKTGFALTATRDWAIFNVKLFLYLCYWANACDSASFHFASSPSPILADNLYSDSIYTDKDMLIAGRAKQREARTASRRLNKKRYY